MCKFFASGVCKLTKYVWNCIVFWKNLHSWQKFYRTAGRAGRDGRDKFQVCDKSCHSERDNGDKTCHSERMIRPGPFHHLTNGWSQPQHCPVSTTSIIIYWTCPISMTVACTCRLVRVTIARPGLLGTSRIPPRSDGDGCSERLFLKKVKVDYIGKVNSQWNPTTNIETMILVLSFLALKWLFIKTTCNTGKVTMS